MMLTKVNMFGGEEGKEIEFYYQWKGGYTKEQMSDEMLRVEKYLDANRKRFDIEQIFSRYREQGWAGTRLTFGDDAGAIKPLVDAIRKELPKSARATIGAGDHDGPGGGGPGQKAQVILVGDSTQTLAEIAGTSCRSWPSARNCATCASTAATPTAS